MTSGSSLRLGRGMRRGFTMLRRQRGYGTTLGALCAVALLLQSGIVGVIGVSAAAREAQSNLQLSIPLQGGAPDETVQELLIAVRSFVGVTGVTYVTREQALAREQIQNPGFEVPVLQNPFSDSISLTLGSVGTLPSFVTFIRQSTSIAAVDPLFFAQASAQEQAVLHSLRTLMTARILTSLVAALLVCALFALLIDLVRRRAALRRDELLVGHMAGAPDSTLRMSFVAEAGTLLFASLLIGGIVTAGALLLLPALLPYDSTLAAFALDTLTPMIAALLPVIMIGEVIAVFLMAFGAGVLGLPPCRSRYGLLGPSTQC